MDDAPAWQQGPDLTQGVAIAGLADGGMLLGQASGCGRRTTWLKRRGWTSIAV